MVTRNSIVSPNGYRYFLVPLQEMAEFWSPLQPPCLTQDGQGIILLYNDIIVDVYGEDRDFESTSPMLKNLGYTTLAESTFGYFTWEADSEILLNYDSPYIYWTSTTSAATSGMIITKKYSGSGDSPFKGTDVTLVQSTASINAVAGGGASYFEGCTQLREVVMHNATYFGDRCFYGCTALQSLYLNRKAATWGTDCFGGNAGVTRGEIYAEGLTGSSSTDKWVWDDIPTELQAKHWIVYNYESDGTEYSDYYRVDVYQGAYTVTPSPAWTTLAGVEGDFAADSTNYELTVTGFEEGESLKGWYQSTYREWLPISTTYNPTAFTFEGNTYLEPLNYDPNEMDDVKPIDPEEK